MYRLCQAYQALPEAGGVLDQPVSVLRMHAILEAGGYFDQQGEVPSADTGTSVERDRYGGATDVFVGIKTVAL